MSVVTRFAPSPTGKPHIGSATTSLWNYAFARRHRGKFILRIEDTDRSRSTKEFELAIREGLAWLGLDWDEGPDKGGPHGPYRQSERGAIYARHAQTLLDAGLAYACFCTEERLELLRQSQRAQGQPPRYDGRCRTMSPQEVQARTGAGEAHVLRMKVPQTGITEVHDRLRGRVAFENAGLDDQVLVKSDGFPTYHLAAVVDDHLMGVTDVIRGEEWLSSTPKHVLLHRAFGWDPPRFCHTPLGRNPDRSRMKKRDHTEGLFGLREAGYLPEAILNFVATLGWSYPDGRDRFNLAEMIEVFDLDKISLGGPVVDLDKLAWLNGKWIREAFTPEALAPRVKPFLARAGYSWPDEDYLVAVIASLQTRVETLADLVSNADYFFIDRVSYDPRAERKLDAKTLRLLGDRLAALPSFDQGTTEPAVRKLAEELGVKAGEVIQPLRAALTGRLESPGMFEVLAILGRERTLARIDAAVEHLGAVPR